MHRWLDGKLIKTFPRRHADDVTRLSPDKKDRPRGKIALDVTGLPSLTSIPGRHFLQEDQAAAVAEFIARTAHRAG